MDLKNLSKRELGRLVKKYPLPEGAADRVFSKEKLAKAFVKSVNTIDQWLDEGMPVLERGSNGQAYQFQFSHCWAWWHAREDERREIDEADRRTIQASMLALTGGETGDSIDGLTPKQKREVIETQVAYETFRKTRGELIERSEVVELTETLFGLVRDVLNAMPDRLEREANLDAGAVEASITICDDTMADLHHRIEQFFNVRPLTDGRERRDLFDA